MKQEQKQSKNRKDFKNYILIIIVIVTLYTALNTLFVTAATCGASITCNCNDTLNSSYSLSSSLSCNGTALNINVSDINVNCALNNLTGDTTGVGILLQNVSNVTLQNCLIVNFTTGVYVNYTNDSNITNNSIYNNSLGLFVNNYNNTINNNTIQNNTIDINLTRSSSNNTLFENHLISNLTQYDENNSNKWNATIGNYWAYYDTVSENCLDVNSSGFCDNPYNIQGGGSNSDKLPIVTPVEFGVMLSSNMTGLIVKKGTIAMYNITITNLGNDTYNFTFAANDFNNSTSTLNQTQLLNIGPFGGLGSIMMNVTNNTALTAIANVNVSNDQNNSFWNETNITTYFNNVGCDEYIGNDINLTADLNCANTGLLVNSSNLNIDCNNYTINGSNSNGSIGYTGINITNFHNTTIINCNISDYFTGIHVEGSNHSTLFYNQISYSGDTGINLTNAHFSNVSNNTFSHNNRTSIKVNGSHHNAFNLNDIRNTSSYGIELSNSSNNSLQNNSILNNTIYNIFINRESFNNTIFQNILTLNNSVNDTGSNWWNLSSTSGGGNVWLDYNTAGENCADTAPQDGFCDAYLNIPGTNETNNTDALPHLNITCGDNVINYGESCEGANLNGHTCVTQGINLGTLRCNADCTFDTSDCTNAPGGNSQGGSGGGGGGGTTISLDDLPDVPTFTDTDLFTGGFSPENILRDLGGQDEQTEDDDTSPPPKQIDSKPRDIEIEVDDETFLKTITGKFDNLLNFISQDKKQIVIIRKLKEGESTTIEIGGIQHRVTALSVQPQTTKIELQSRIITSILNLKQDVVIDFEPDKRNDVIITLLEVLNKTATIKFIDITPQTGFLDTLQDLYKIRKPLKVNKAVICKQFNNISINDFSYVHPVIPNFPLKIDKGRVIAVEPFGINCSAQPKSTLTFNFPTDLEYLKAEKCRLGICEKLDLEKVSKINCGSNLIQDLQSEILSSTLDTNVFNTSGLDKQSSIIAENNETLEFKITYLTENITEPLNPQLKMISPPTKIELSDTKLQDNTSIHITIPYVTDPNVDANSIGIYSFNNDSWNFIGGSVNRNEGTITVRIENLAEHFSNQKAIFSLMGILCKDCERTSFENIYQPIGGSVAAVILVHGLGSNPTTYNDMINDIRFTQQPWQVWTFAYPSNNLIVNNGIDFANSIESFSDQFQEIYIVGHSLGGSVTQAMLNYAYGEHLRDPTKFKFVNKVKSAVLIGSTNEKVGGNKIFQLLFKYVSNLRTGEDVFDPNSTIIRELSTDNLADQVPHVKYFVIAGTKSYNIKTPFITINSDDLFNFNESNDGIITVSNAQHIGDEFVDDLCENFWEIYETHTDLLDSEKSRKVIERIIAEEVSENQRQDTNTVNIGANKFYEMQINNCQDDDVYIISGTIVKKEKAEDLTGCSCGNGFCNIGEDATSCPSDCASLFTKENICYPNMLLLFTILMLIAVIRTLFARISELINYFHVKVSRTVLDLDHKILNIAHLVITKTLAAIFRILFLYRIPLDYLLEKYTTHAVIAHTKLLKNKHYKKHYNNYGHLIPRIKRIALYTFLAMLGLQAIFCGFIVLDILILIFVGLLFAKRETTEITVKKSKKNDEKTVIKREALSKLSHIHKYADQKKLRNELSKIMGEFFAQFYKVRYQFTFTELIHELRTKNVKQMTIDKLVEVHTILEQIKYAKRKFGRKNAKALINEVKQIITEID